MSWAQGQPVLRPLEGVQPALCECLLLSATTATREKTPQRQQARSRASARVSPALRRGRAGAGRRGRRGAGPGPHSEQLGSRPRSALCPRPRHGQVPGSWTPLACAGPQHPGRPEAAGADAGTDPIPRTASGEPRHPAAAQTPEPPELARPDPAGLTSLGSEGLGARSVLLPAQREHPAAAAATSSCEARGAPPRAGPRTRPHLPRCVPRRPRLRSAACRPAAALRPRASRARLREAPRGACRPPEAAPRPACPPGLRGLVLGLLAAPPAAASRPSARRSSPGGRPVQVGAQPPLSTGRTPEQRPAPRSLLPRSTRPHRGHLRPAAGSRGRSARPLPLRSGQPPFHRDPADAYRTGA